MTQEEKAKAYDEAIKRVENIKTGKCKTTFMFTEGLFEHIFPELAESEDERIRQAIVSFIDEMKGDFDSYEDIKLDEMVAWLEKQGEQKPQRIVSAEAKEAMYDKPAWSEEVEEPVSGELEKAVNAYISNENNYSHSRSDTFKAGAEWHEQQMKEALRTEYEKGRHDALEEMKKSNQC